ncbi:MAG: hypothetical protein ACQEUB_14330 [Thermodesulfobacteriota bacterium]
MQDERTTSAQEVVQECFWGDYTLSAQNLLAQLDSGDLAFQRFLFSKIVENSRHPSRHLRALYPPEQLQALLKDYMPKARDQKRIRLIAANLTQNYALAQEYQWRA